MLTFGTALEAELDGIEGKNKKAIENRRQRTLAKWLDQEVRYRNPVATQSSGPTPAAASDIEQSYTFSGDGSEAPP